MKTILITGSTDGIGLETVKMLAHEGHNLIIHGRNADKLKHVEQMLSADYPAIKVTGFVADLSSFEAVDSFATKVAESFSSIDVIINNAGVFHSPSIETAEGLDVRFMVNTIAPFIITQKLMSLMPLTPTRGRIVNVSSAAQAPVNFDLLGAAPSLSDGMAYAQSKLAITMWTRFLAEKYTGSGPLFVSVNPKSLLGSKMVKEAYGVAGGDLAIGAKIFVEAALSDRFANVKGEYFDNDNNQFAPAHPFGENAENRAKLVSVIESVIAGHLN
ncbi:SDR family NAD(P)-dependent oxidoreductase [Alteromonas sp. 1_MG-2023]|uniref:SDR family NAD(P)-dependent oxidoreductase n=1 Tax=Alteromonas sp. 1_MG-2023 TaxID=3062669 RepID=UPI0026E151B9|nr:SDR family NAD(P)-dependent oxidoreductase [Alteromonas sp. 1_MG-2023]MDO6568902.1 SDR family NAD(P)-dependent oxidoreductase [Alteromonas sp. 1_MG-2023]